MRNILITTALTALAAGACALPAAAFPACTSQQQIEQVKGSNGKYIPEDCRELTIVKVESQGREYCVLDFESGGEAGFIDRLSAAALPTKWWVACENLKPR